ncbi:MAG: hypothetical protein HQK60_14060 [Deltaproteobacteria bacterium]|nr:hypothetical protein [Deltaproteobacteria bacterium]
MKRYRIELSLRIEEVSATEVTGLKELDPGHVQAVIDEDEAVNISVVERKVLTLGYEVFRNSLSKHLTAVSKSRALSRVLDGELVVNDTPYRVDGEVGRFEFMTHRIVQEGKSVYDTSKEVFPPRHGCEWHATVGFKEIVIGYGVTERSYRKTSGMINRIRHQYDATPCKTINDQTKSEGMAIVNHIEHKVNQILTESGFCEDIGLKYYNDNDPNLFSKADVREAIKN